MKAKTIIFVFILIISIFMNGCATTKQPKVDIITTDRIISNENKGNNLDYLAEKGIIFQQEGNITRIYIKKEE